MRWLLPIVIAAGFALPACAAGIDSRGYTCANLHALIAARGFVFISQPAFGDFVVASPYFCGGGQQVELRSVPTADTAECPINYCIPRYDNERQ
ncbi:MAG TPA: hypothetical protein VJR70_11685 [Stellaceae bacterium]|nr:hypothetical protein [Stellaceae bacterium]